MHDDHGSMTMAMPVGHGSEKGIFLSVGVKFQENSRATLLF